MSGANPTCASHEWCKSCQIWISEPGRLTVCVPVSDKTRSLCIWLNRPWTWIFRFIFKHANTHTPMRHAQTCFSWGRGGICCRQIVTEKGLGSQNDTERRLDTTTGQTLWCKRWWGFGELGLKIYVETGGLFFWAWEREHVPNFVLLLFSTKDTEKIQVMTQRQSKSWLDCHAQRSTATIGSRESFLFSPKLNSLLTSLGAMFPSAASWRLDDGRNDASCLCERVDRCRWSLTHSDSRSAHKCLGGRLFAFSTNIYLNFWYLKLDISQQNHLQTLAIYDDGEDESFRCQGLLSRSSRRQVKLHGPHPSRFCSSSRRVKPSGFCPGVVCVCHSVCVCVCRVWRETVASHVPYVPYTWTLETHHTYAYTPATRHAGKLFQLSRRRNERDKLASRSRWEPNRIGARHISSSSSPDCKCVFWIDWWLLLLLETLI